MVDILAKLFKRVLDEEDIPTERAKMLVATIHKKSDWHDTSNYRAIAFCRYEG